MRSSARIKVRFVVDPNAALSPYAKYATVVFKRGVQRAYADLAKKGVCTVVLRDGVTIKGIPRRVNGKFVVVSENAPKKLTRVAS